MKKFILFSICVAVSLCYCVTVSLCYGVTVVHADSTITAIPPRLMLTSDPGQTLTAELKVRNDSDTSQIYTVAVEDFLVQDTAGTPLPVTSPLSSHWSLKSWISAPQIIPVDAHDSQIVKLTFKIPLNASAGGHYAMITYTPSTEALPDGLSQSASLIGQRVGSLLYLTVSGSLTENAALLQFQAPSFSEQGPVNFTGSVKNLSDIHVNPQGIIVIINPLGQKVAEIPVETGNIFPETSRNFTGIWNQKWGWGRYRADLHLTYGTTGGLVTGTLFFWLFPLRLVLIILIALLSVLIIIFLLHRRNQRHKAFLEKEVTLLKQELEQKP